MPNRWSSLWVREFPWVKHIPPHDRIILFDLVMSIEKQMQESPADPAERRFARELSRAWCGVDEEVLGGR